MINILHLSDFHLCDETRWQLSESKLGNLKDALKDIKIDYLVFTGDVVDAASIFLKIRDSLTKYGEVLSKAENYMDLISKIQPNSIKDTRDIIINEYNEMLDKEYERAFYNATNFFDQLIKGIGIPPENVFICPGNHDVMEPIALNINQPKCSSEESGTEITDLCKNRLRYFNEFCKNLGVNGSSENKYYPKDDICFFSINTNFRMYGWKPTSKSCIHCTSLEEKLRYIAEIRNKNLPIITFSHEPLENVCENVNFDFKEGGNKPTVHEKVLQLSDVVLSGDKHTTREKHENQSVTFTCGNSLRSNHIQYKIVHIDNKDSKYDIESENIIYDQASWKIVPTLKVSNEVFLLSREYLKDLSLKFLCGPSVTEQSTGIPHNFTEIMEKIQPERVQLTSKFFRCGMHVIPRRESESKEHDKQTIFDHIWSKFECNSELCVKGNPGVGKSTLLGAFYLMSLIDYTKGNSRYLPFYFNIQFSSSTKEDNSSNNDMSFHDIKREELIRFIKTSYETAAKHNAPPLLIIDGLAEKVIWKRRDEKESIEGSVRNLLDSLYDSCCKSCLDNPRHLLGIDDHTDLGLPNNGLLRSKDLTGIRLDGLMVSLMPRYKQRFLDMVETYFALFGDSKKAKENAEKFYLKCMELRITDVDYHFLEANANTIMSSSGDDSKNIFDWISQKTNNLFTRRERQKIEKYAFELEMHGLNFVECCDLIKMKDPNDSIEYRSYAIIIEKPDIRRFLVANFLVRFIYNDWKDNAYLSDLNVFIDRRIMSYIKLIIKWEDPTLLVQELYSRYDADKVDVSGIALCNLAYLFSRCKCSGKKFFSENKRLNGDAMELMNHKKKMTQIIASKPEDKLAACNYVEELILNPITREYVRRYQRLYYGDLDCRKWKESNEDTLQKGFDYFRCFQILSVKISNALDQDNPRRYKLLEYDLFTLCDLTLARLQKPHFNDEYTTGIKTLFFDSSYYARDEILQCLVVLLEKYLNNTRLESKVACEGSHPLVYHYFDYAISEFRNVLNALKPNDKNTNDGDAILGTCAKQYNALLTYLNSERLGWRIRSSMSELGEDDFKSLSSQYMYDPNRQLIEADRRDGADPDAKVITELESNKVASVVLIAQLFLPDDVNKLPKIDESTYRNVDLEQYDKSLIISLLLLRYCGKGQAGDCTPAASSSYQDKILGEQHEYTCDILMPFILQGNTNLGEVFNLINQDYVSERKQKTGNINLLIASEIEMIQLEYQYYLTLKNFASSNNNMSYFSPERKKEFEKDFEGKILFCEHIEKALIKYNPYFVNVL